MKEAWKSMDAKDVGLVRDVVQQGGGKLSLTGGDPGESRKERGTE